MEKTIALLEPIQWQWQYDAAQNQIRLTTSSFNVTDERVFELHQILVSDVSSVAIDRYEGERLQMELFPDQLMLRLGQLVICSNCDLSTMKLDDRNTIADGWFVLDSLQHVDECHSGFMLMSQHLQWFWNHEEAANIPSPFYALPDIPIVKLLPNQHLRITCYCVKHNGLEHSKWSPIGGFTWSLDKSSQGGDQSLVFIQPTGALPVDWLMHQLEQKALRLGHYIASA